MNKSELAGFVASQTGLTQADAKKAVAAIFDTDNGAIVTELANGGEVNITGFGKFSRSHREARDGHNPSTGAPMPIAASNSARFKVGKSLKQALN